MKPLALTPRKIEWHFWNDCSTWREAGGNPPGCIGNDSSKEVWANVQTWRQTCQVFLEKHMNTKSGSSIFFPQLFSSQPIPLSFVFPASLPFDLLYCLCHSCIKKLETHFIRNYQSERSDNDFFQPIKRVGYFFKGWSSSPPYWVTSGDTFFDFFFFSPRKDFVSQKLKWGAKSLSWIPAWAADLGEKKEWLRF